MAEPLLHIMPQGPMRTWWLVLPDTGLESLGRRCCFGVGGRAVPVRDSSDEGLLSNSLSCVDMFKVVLHASSSSTLSRILSIGRAISPLTALYSMIRRTSITPGGIPILVPLLTL